MVEFIKVDPNRYRRKNYEILYLQHHYQGDLMGRLLISPKQDASLRKRFYSSLCQTPYSSAIFLIQKLSL